EAEERLGGGIGTGRAEDQLRRQETPAVAVDLRAQPLAQRRELAVRDQGVEVAEVAMRRLVELRRVEVAERVGREVPERAHRPVDVLQAAFGVVARPDAEQLAALLAP